MQIVGIRDLKNKLSHYLQVVRKGDPIIITDRGVPVAILHDLDQIEETAGPDERLASLAKRGLLTLPKRSVPGGFPPIETATVTGKPVSRMIIEDRR